MLVTSSRRTRGVWFGAFGPGFKDKLIQDGSKLIWKISCLHQAGFISFTNNDCNARENNLQLVHLSCISLNYACKAMVFSKQPYSKGQNTFTRHHKNLLGSFKISLNSFLSNRVGTRYTQAEGVLLSSTTCFYVSTTEQMTLKLTATNMAKHSNVLKTHEKPKQYADRHWCLKEVSIFYHKISLRIAQCQLCPH